MSTTAAVVLPPQQNPPNSPRHRHPRRRPFQPGGAKAAETTTTTVPAAMQEPGAGILGRSGGVPGRSQPNNNRVPLALTPASIPPRSRPPSTEPSSADVPATEHRSRDSHRSRGGRSGGVAGQPRGGHGMGAVGSQGRQGHTNHRHHGVGLHVAGGRQFGGQLTVDEHDRLASGQTVGSHLQADAAVFQPGQEHRQRQRLRGGHAQAFTRGRRPSKSHAPDIPTRTHEDINNGYYECPICTSEVLRNSKTWSCQTCWTVFHLSCIKKWSTNEGSTQARQQVQGADLPPPRQWRCPGCNLPKDEIPSRYTCWCEKELEPRPISGLPPHSCGQTCGRARTLPKKCPHPCDLICHAGPCPPCTHLGPTRSCFCGKETATRRCVDTNYENGWSCGQICGDIMSCGEHTCPRECHSGLCGACEVRIDARCFCGQDEKSLMCADRGDEKGSKRVHTSEDGKRIVEEWVGIYKCANTCNRLFDCRKHQCERSCHAQMVEVEHCPRSPDVLTHCPCGKTQLSDILDGPRTGCEDPIPNCKKACLKPLACGHLCRQICHSGECLPCLETVSITCHCGRTTSKSICHQGTEEPPQCMRVCRATLNCGRHECGEHCCPGERKAAERQTIKRKARPLNAGPRPVEEGFEAEHICTRPCGRTLKCGNHSCQELCHKGPCGSCREAIFDEISCDCGRTVLQPPLPCGTEPPPCRYPCERPKACGHAQVAHNCHQNDESCPRCPFLVTKICMCGKRSLKNQQCWLSEVRCGKVCGKKLRCGSHTCQKPCHKPGECEDAKSPCQQPCGKPKKACGHPCEDPCHAPYPCREDKPCPHKIFITCECQHQKQEVRCSASKASEGNKTKSLKCDDECARLERNRKLALALNIDPETHKDDHIPYSAETLKIYLEDVQWAQAQEREFRVFADSDEEKRLRFKPMPQHQRAFIHSLAEDFGLDSESMDPEPHRHVAVFKTPRFVSMPTKTLAECARIRLTQARIAGAEAAQRKQAISKPHIVTNNDPYNAFLLTRPRFGLTLSELSAVVDTLLPKGKSGLALTPTYLPSEEIVLRAQNENHFTPLADNDMSLALRNLKPNLSQAVQSHAFGELQLCRVDDSFNILRRESDDDSTTTGGGWNRVAAKAAAPRRTAVQENPRQGKNTFMVLGNKAVLAARAEERKEKEKEKRKVVEKKKKKEVVVDDWEEAELVEEQGEKEAGRSLEGSKLASVASVASVATFAAESGEKKDARTEIIGMDGALDEDKKDAQTEISGVDGARDGGQLDGVHLLDASKDSADIVKGM